MPRATSEASPDFAPYAARPWQAAACATALLALTFATGCAQLQLPPPDAPSARLPQSQASQEGAPAMTDAQKQELTRLNKHIYDEQESTIERERAQRALNDAIRSYNSNAYFYGGWGSPGWYGPGWYGPGWYGPRSSIGVGIGF
ncbi:hypothetical protein [Pandoraea sputorum]|uniref:hypothetical protein n=1 Tax=Pandoraea sputorum TaxID=93222 RepID=UPI00123FD15B|nr:hypothetical protein [Pandoraea sputorum]BET09182.1 hypothetical protein THI4931_02240 [Pandoraea sputorum]VVE01944.1 hypothetical protein PSP20601_02183 [Pandoraea sputorum]